MHTGGIALLEGPAPPYVEVLEHVRARLHAVPRYRRRLAAAPLGLGDAQWVDDPAFNLTYHVRHTGLPAPGDGTKLHTMAARVFSQQLDRSKPLWELWIVEHLAGGGWALVSKAGLELVEDATDADLMATLFDPTPEVAPVPAVEAWEPRPPPTSAQLAASAVNEALSPQAVLGRVARAVRAAGERARTGLAAPPESPLRVRSSPHCRLAVVDSRLEDFRAVKDALGGTVNDVVLAVVAGAIRHWLHERGTRTEGLELSAGVPVSIADDRLAQVACPLPVGIVDPIERLHAITAHMQQVATTQGAVSAGLIGAGQDFAPPTILARAARLSASSSSGHSLLITNVPGPQSGLYFLGRRLERTFPIPSLPKGHALGVAVMSYDGGMDFGLLAGYDALPDLDTLALGLVESLAELVGLAGSGPLGRRKPRTTRTRARARAKRQSAKKR